MAPLEEEASVESEDHPMTNLPWLGSSNKVFSTQVAPESVFLSLSYWAQN